MPEGNQTSDRYPWYDVVNGAELEQGDILFDCPVLQMTLQNLRGTEETPVTVKDQNAIILTQSCDLVLRADNACAVEDVVLCPIYSRDELSGDRTYGRPKSWEEARKGRHASYHVLNRCDIAGHELNFHLVDLSRAFSVKFGVLRELAVRQGPRLRLNPPYREHLSQAFARFFMRVGLPVDIPVFR